MLDLKVGGKAKQVLETSSLLFGQYGFTNVGVDTIVRESKIAKMTLYQYFESKEKMVEVGLYLNKEVLKEQVEAICYQTSYSTAAEKLKQIYLLHADLESPYHLLLRAVIEVKGIYPLAFDIVAKYRKWLINTIHLLLTQSKPSADFQDAHMFLFIIDGSLNLLLNPELAVENDLVFNYFLKKVCPL
ncbi:TetR/AcrR family transcriptional regulator [Acinetobacter baumannii]|nr:TetR/AcrR family transcriptional regulator [Acinetobacter baumannii]